MWRSCRSRRKGHGPLLVMVAGVGASFGRIAAILRDRLTVLTYDRRCQGARHRRCRAGRETDR